MVTTEWYFGNENLSDVHLIRRKVFIEEQHIDEKIEMDDTDASCIHLAAYSDGKPMATGRVLITNNEFIIGRVAVLPAYRKKQMGTFIMQILIHACYTMGGEHQIVHAQLAAQSFYEKLGFNAYGDVYDEAGIPHISMEHFGDIDVICNK